MKPSMLANGSLFCYYSANKISAPALLQQSGADIRRGNLQMQTNSITVHPSVINRFWSKIHKTESCWEWRGYIAKVGYGQLSIDGCLWYSHRLSWVIAYGFIPDNLSVLHRCDNRKCCRPDHLFVGTRQDNSRDMANKGRSTWGIRNPNARLTAEQVIQIREMHVQGARNCDIAKTIGTTSSNISHILRGDSWGKAW